MNNFLVGTFVTKHDLAVLQVRLAVNARPNVRLAVNARPKLGLAVWLTENAMYVVKQNRLQSDSK